MPFYARFSPSFVATRYGVKLRANWQDATFVLCRFGLYGRGLADFLTTQNTPFIFIDIGANQGLFSLLAAQNPYCTQVLAFEPVSASYALLQENIAHSEQREKIKPIQQAVSGQAGHATMRLRSGHSGAATLERENLTGYHTQEVVETIDITGLDAQLLVQGAILIKIDVEGFESKVIAGASQTIMREKPILLIEIENRHLEGKSIIDIFDQISEFGYEGGFLYKGRIEKLADFHTQIQAKQNYFLDNMSGSNYINNFIFQPLV